MSNEQTNYVLISLANTEVTGTRLSKNYEELLDYAIHKALDHIKTTDSEVLEKWETIFTDLKTNWQTSDARYTSRFHKFDGSMHLKYNSEDRTFRFLSHEEHFFGDDDFAIHIRSVTPDKYYDSEEDYD